MLNEFVTFNINSISMSHYIHNLNGYHWAAQKNQELNTLINFYIVKFISNLISYNMGSMWKLTQIPVYQTLYNSQK
jgi:hypothetical protein